MLLLAFSIQAFVTQTHIHTPSVVKAVAANSASHNPTGHDNYPGNDDPANCPLCQQILHSGAFVAPASLAFFLPMLAVSVIAIATRPTARLAATSHIWRGRGPPRR